MSKRSIFTITAKRTVCDPHERARRLAMALQYVLAVKDDKKARPANDGKPNLGKVA